MWILSVGDLFDRRYRIERELGAGGMSYVYAARDEELDETVALKIIKPELMADADMVERFKREVRIARQLRHDNIIHVFEFGRAVVEKRALYYITMELLEGVDLATWMTTHGSIPLRDSLHVVIQLCDALGEAHRYGAIHRDIKPTNVFIDRPGHVKLMDFGVSRLSTLPGLTQGGEFFGTPRYMSPEQVHGRREIDHRSDIYSLGVVLYELCTGRTPFDGETPVRIALRHIQDTPPKPRDLRPDLPPALEYVILKCLDKDPRFRYPSAAELRAELEEILRELESDAAGGGEVLAPSFRISEPETLANRDYWKAFAPGQDAEFVLNRVLRAVAEPHLTIDSQEVLGAGLRFHFQGRLGLAAFLIRNVVMTSFPFIREGSPIDMRILEVISAPASMERWIVAQCKGMKLSFYDTFCSTGITSYQVGEQRTFVLNALALSLNRVTPLWVPEDLHGLLELSSSRLRKYVPRKGKSFDQGIFQTTVEEPIESLPLDERVFTRIPISLGSEGERVRLDLFAASELVGSLGASLAPGEEIAGVLWLQGYPPEHLPREPRTSPGTDPGLQRA